MENLTLFAQNHPLLPSFFSNYCICAHNIKRCLDVKVVYNCPCVAYVFTIPCTNCLTFTATSPKQTECRTDSQDYQTDEILSLPFTEISPVQRAACALPFEGSVPSRTHFRPFGFASLRQPYDTPSCDLRGAKAPHFVRQGT